MLIHTLLMGNDGESFSNLRKEIPLPVGTILPDFFALSMLSGGIPHQR
jgi:hypothetical protein